MSLLTKTIKKMDWSVESSILLFHRTFPDFIVRKRVYRIVGGGGSLGGAFHVNSLVRDNKVEVLTAASAGLIWCLRRNVSIITSELRGHQMQEREEIVSFGKHTAFLINNIYHYEVRHRYYELDDRTPGFVFRTMDSRKVLLYFTSMLYNVAYVDCRILNGRPNPPVDNWFSFCPWLINTSPSLDHFPWPVHREAYQAIALAIHKAIIAGNLKSLNFSNVHPDFRGIAYLAVENFSSLSY